MGLCPMWMMQWNYLNFVRFLLCAISHFSCWIYYWLNALWIISEKCDSINVTAIHTIANNTDNNVLDVLPAEHALSSCDTTSKVSIKSAAFYVVIKCGYELLHSFGKSEISDQMILSAEKFLVKCISKSSEINNFSDIRIEMYYKQSFQLKKFRKITTGVVIHPNLYKMSIFTVLSLDTYMHCLSNLLKWTLTIIDIS